MKKNKPLPEKDRLRDCFEKTIMRWYNEPVQLSYLVL